METANPTQHHNRTASKRFRSQLRVSEMNVPLAPNPRSATLITMYAKWYQCEMERSCINTSWYARIAAERIAMMIARRITVR